MRFEQVKKVRKDNKARKLIERFLSSNHDKVEVFNEGDYDNNKKMAAALRFVIKKHYPDLIHIKYSQDRVYLNKLKKDRSL